MKLNYIILVLISFFIISCKKNTPIEFNPEDYYIWDNWLLEDGDKLHRYFLTAPRSLTPDQRHDRAYISHAVSLDKGETWDYLGPVLKPNTGADWPNLVVWSGSALKYGDEILLFITGRSKEDGLLQKIGMARSSDGHNFSRIKLILSPVEDLNYDISDNDGVIMAWRDPFIFKDPKTDDYHMFFSAKQKLQGETVATVGHASTEDESLEDWHLEKPLQLSRSYAQIEVPNLIYLDSKYHLLVSTQNYPEENTNLKKEAQLVHYKADSLDSEWNYQSDIAGSDFYATTIFKMDGEYYASAFWSEHMPKPISPTPIFKLAL